MIFWAIKYSEELSSRKNVEWIQSREIYCKVRPLYNILWLYYPPVWVIDFHLNQNGQTRTRMHSMRGPRRGTHGWRKNRIQWGEEEEWNESKCESAILMQFNVTCHSPVWLWAPDKTLIRKSWSSNTFQIICHSGAEVESNELHLLALL